MDLTQKLSYLEQLTKTRNKIPASNMSYDATNYNRPSAGEKITSKDASYIREMASFFAAHCTETKRINELLSAMNKRFEIVPDSTKLEDLIFQWLSGGPNVDSRQTRSNTSHGPNNKRAESPPNENQTDIAAGVTEINGTQVFYGNEGRRRACIQVLCEVLKMPKPCTLMLLSEENLDWMTENHDFLMTWAALLQQVLVRGNRIKVIHHINRGMEDLMLAIRQWMPIYLSGAVEPYYNPNVKEIFFRRTLFIAPGCAAIFSNSVVGGADKTANYLVRENKAIETAVSEFEDYMSFCQPLFKICGEDKINDRKKQLEAFETAKADTFLITHALADLPMPAEAIELSTRGLDPESRGQIISLHRKRAACFEELLSQNSFHVMLEESDCKSYGKRQKPLVYSGLELNNGLVYSAETQRLQLLYLVSLMKRFDNFHVYLTDIKNRDDHVIYGKADVGVLIIKAKIPTTCFSVTESSLTSALWNYMRGIVGKSFGSKENKKQTINKLDALLKQL